MGTTTDAYLYFGFTFHDEETHDSGPDWINEEDTDWGSVYVARAAGILAPDEEYNDRNKKVFHEYWEKRNARVDDCPCEINTHCSGDYPAYFVTLKSKRFTAHRGYPVEVNLIEPTKKEIKQLKDFCDLMKIKWQTPRWELASYWG